MHDNDHIMHAMGMSVIQLLHHAHCSSVASQEVFGLDNISSSPATAPLPWRLQATVKKSTPAAVEVAMTTADDCVTPSRLSESAANINICKV